MLPQLFPAIFYTSFFFSPFVQVLGIPHPRYHAVAYATAVEALKEKLQAMEPSTVTTGFRDRATKAWQAVRDAGATMIPAKVRCHAVGGFKHTFGCRNRRRRRRRDGWMDL